MLILYRRHMKGCSKASDRFYKRCCCPMWVEGTANGTYVRRSLKTSSWERATELSRIIKVADKPAESPERTDEPVTIVQAVEEYLADAKARELADATLYKLEIQLRKQLAQLV